MPGSAPAALRPVTVPDRRQGWRVVTPPGIGPEPVHILVSDLDGPILDVRKRHYACYSSILRSLGFDTVSERRYWAMKRRMTPLASLLDASGAGGALAAFPGLWRERIERPELLAKDTVQPGAARRLRGWMADGLHVVVATLRQHPGLVSSQLSDLGLDDFGAVARVADQACGATGKAALVGREAGSVGRRRVLWVGDTEVDVDAARVVGCPVVAVTCGLRTPGRLAQLHPDAMARSVGSIRLVPSRDYGAVRA